MNFFKDNISGIARLALALLASFILVSCGGGGGNAATGGNSAVPLQGKLALPAGDNTNKYTVFNSNQSSTPSSDGSFSTAVAKDSPTFTYAISDTGTKVYAAVSTNADGSMTINAQSTAEAMVLLNPLLIPRTSVERTQIINIVKSDAAVRSLATVIESVYGTVEDPMSDTRISDALTSAVSSVLTSWQASISSLSNAVQKEARQKNVPLALVTRSAVSGSSSIQILPTLSGNDMGALTLANSAGSTLKLELNNVGVGGITTNVDWVVRIVELDPAKIQWTKSGSAVWGNPTLIDIDSLIKTGGYDQKTIIEGAVGSGLLKFIVDPIGKVADSFGEIVFPDNGINLPHDGVYAIIALSGSRFGDSAEYNSVKNSLWQVSMSADAAAINIASAAIDVIGVGTTFINAATGVDIDISPLLEVELGAIKTELTANPDYVSSTYFIGKTADIIGKLLDFLKPYIHSSISDLQSSGWKKFFHIAVNAAQSVVDVWSGTVSASTRVANYIYNVTPRESGYAVLGTYTAAAETTPPSVPSGLTATPFSSSQINLTWSASTDNVGVTGYKIYRGGSLIASQATLSYSNTGLSPSTQYCYTVSAFDAAGNESVQSSQQCATTQAGVTIPTAPTAPTGVTATAGNGQTTISWTAVTGAVSYNVYMASVSGVTKSNYSSLAGGVKGTGVTSPSIQASLTNGTTYYFVVTAVNANGESIESSQVSATPQLLVVPIAIAAAQSHSLALKSDGSVWAWGDNTYGEFGNGTTTSSSTLVQVSLTGATAIAGGYIHSLAIKGDGTVWAWGDNVVGQLGDGTRTNKYSPVQVSGLTGVIAITAGYEHTLALKGDGTVWAWGFNGNGQLGYGQISSNNYSTIPIQVVGLTGVTRVAAGEMISLALKSDGTVWAWGHSPLGDGGASSSTPVQVSGLTGITAIAAAGGPPNSVKHSLALKGDGTVWAWGGNSFGQLGDGTQTDRSIPIQVSGLSGVTAIAAGDRHSLAIKGDGTVWAWGSNSSGRLGNGTTTNSYIPVQVSGLTGATAIEGGEFHSLALKGNGTVWAWGSNSVRQLGDGTTTDRYTPVQVIGF